MLSGTLHLAWSEGLIVDNEHTALDLYYQTNDGTGWSVAQAVYTATLDSRYPVIAVEDDDLSLLWQEGSIADRDVYFTRQFTPGTCVGLSGVTIEGPTTGFAGKPQTLAASSGPLTATWPVTYTWQAGEQATVVHTGGFLDQVDFTWMVTGPKSITVTAENCGEIVTAQHSIAIEPSPYSTTYLPWVLKDLTP